MKRIMIISEVCVYGVYDHLYDLINILLKNNYEVYFVYGKKRTDVKMLDYIKENKNIYAIEIESFKEKVSFGDIISVFKIRKLIKKIKPDIVHCHSSIGGLSGRIAAKMSGVKKIIYSPHGYYFLGTQTSKIKTFIYLNAEKILSYFFTDYTIATSISEEKCFQNNKIDKNNKCILIEHGIKEEKLDSDNVKNLKEKIQYKEKDFVVGWMGRFSNQKDPETMLEIFKILSKDGIKCIIFSDKIDYKIEDKNIFYLGRTFYPNEALSIMDIYLSTSLYEGLPYTMIKALCLSRPIVATNVIGNSDCIYNEKNGFLFEIKNIEKAVAGIYKIKNENMKENMGKESYRIFKTRFSLESMEKKYLELYRGSI